MSHFSTIKTKLKDRSILIEERIGQVTYIETKPEYYQNQLQKDVTLQHNQDQT